MRKLAVSLLSALCVACSTALPPPPTAAPSPWKSSARPGNPSGTADNQDNPSASTNKSVVYFGNDPIFAPTGSKPRGGLTPAGVHGVELKFHDADIHAVIDTILGDALKLNYTVDSAVQGKITLRTGKPVAKEALLSALEAALAAVGAAIVAQDGIYHVVPLDTASQRVRGITRPAGPAMPGFAVEILPLRYVGAKEIQGILETVAPKGTVLQADEAHNHLVIAGTSQDRAAVQQTVASFDVDWLQHMSFALYPIEQSSPSQVISELKDIFQPPIGIIGSRVRFIALDRVHSILGIARDRADLQLVEGWVKQLDVPKLGGQRVFVYNVQNGNAKDLAKAIRQLLSGRLESGQPEVGYGGTGLSMDTPSPADSGGYALGGDRGEARQLLYAQSPQSGGSAGKLIAVEETNSLLFYGTEDEYRVIKDALRQLDVTPRQVMIEAILAEVTLKDDLSYGVQWFLSAGENSLTLSAKDAALSPAFPGFSYVYSGTSDVRVVLNALQSKSEVRVLSAPKLAVLNNQKATLQVGDQVPILSQTAQSTVSPGAPLVSQIQMRDTGLILEIIPRINENGSLILDVSQEVSEVAPTTTSGIDSPTIQKRKIHTAVLTSDGLTVAMGGLIRENGSTGNSGLPFVKDWPVVGNLFRNNTASNRRTELIMLMVPRVVRNPRDTQDVVDALVDGLGAAASVSEHAVPLAHVGQKR